MVIELLRSELMALARTYRGFMVLGVFLIIGLGSPLLAKLMPAIVEVMLSSVPGAVFRVPQPTILDAHWQFQKNVYQLGMLSLVIIFMGTVVNEKSTGRMALLASKPVSRSAIIVSKFLAGTTATTVSMLLSFAACITYSHLLFGGTLYKEAAAAWLVMLADNICLISIVILLSCLSASLTICALLSIGIYLAFSALGLVYQSQAVILPGNNSSIAHFVIGGGVAVADSVAAAAWTLLVAALLVGLAILLFRRQDL